MRNAAIGINEENRQKVATMLNKNLADEHVLYIKTRNYHWNVTGMHFRSLHEFFEEQYTELAIIIDDIAERIRSLGHFALGSMSSFVELASLLETDHREGDAKGMLESLLEDHETIIRIMREDLKKEEEAFRDAGTSDFVTGLMEQHEKMAWMIRSYLN